MKITLYILTLVISSTAYAQCLCGQIRFAIDDTQDYSYKYYEKGSTESKVVKFISNADQLHISSKDSTRVMHKHESYGDEMAREYFDDRNYVFFHIDYLRDFIIEVTNESSKKLMVITFKKSSFDNTYNLLVNFKSGNYNIDLTELQHCFLKHYEDDEIVFRESKIEIVKSNFTESKYEDWMKIVNIENLNTK